MVTSSRNPKVSYTDGKQEFRILCGSIFVLGRRRMEPATTLRMPLVGGKVFLSTMVILLCIVLLVGCATFEPFPDYPAAVKMRVQADFQKQLVRLREEGVPQSIEEAERWFPAPAPGENAFDVYQEALSAATIPERSALLAKAAAMPHYRSPIDWEALPYSSELIAAASRNVADMGNVARLLYDTTVVAARSGDADATTDALVSAFGLVRHTGSTYFNIHQLVRAACIGLTMESLEYSLNGVQFRDSDLRRMDEAIRAAEVPDAIARTWYVEKAVYGLEDPFAYVPNSGGLIALSRSTALFRVARTAIAAERLRLAHDRAPQTLGELVPEFLDAVPIDPFTGEPIRYRVEPDRFIVYSVGWDGVPDPKIASYGLRDKPQDEVFVVVAFDKDPPK
jgi:hypothetical protein